MEFEFDCAEILNASQDGVAIIDGAKSLKRGPQHYASGIKTHPYQKLLNEIVDSLGDASAKAQNLSVSITNSLKFFAGEDRLYLLVYQEKIYGMLRIGNKKLYHRDEIGNVKEIEPLWVLDFYVHESWQRSGYGKFLFEYMLDNEKIEAYKMGYDRPSTKLLNFLKKHYGLENYVSQVNNFVVYNSYFALDKSFKWYIRDPVKPRTKTDATASKSKKEVGYEPSNGYEQYDNYYDNDRVVSDKNQMPSYKDVMKTKDKSYVPKENAYLKESAYEESKNQRKVHFSEASPVVYDLPENTYENDPSSLYQDQNVDPYSSYKGYQGYSAPAGKNYTNPSIESDQFNRKFNRTKAEFSSADTAKDLFNHPESESPLDTVVPRRKQIPIEYDVKKTDMKLADTESELKKCEERLRQLQLKSDELHRTAQSFNKGDPIENKYLGEEQKQLFSGEKETKSFLNSTAYNKRFGYATVFDNKFKNVALSNGSDYDTKSYDQEASPGKDIRKTTLTSAGSNLITQNPNLNIYQHRELMRSSPFGSTGDSAYSKMTSSSTYGSFFGKKKF